jgi:hypothetical protein
MKRSQDHYDDGKLPPPTAAIAAKQSFPNHYHLARRIQNTSSPTPPGIVVHYLPDYPVHLPTISHHDLCLTASQPSMFPETFLPSTIMLIVDSGASISITNDVMDFVTPPRPIQPTMLQGIASGLAVRGIGTVQYNFVTETGTTLQVQLHNTLFVPDCTTRLLCPRHLAASTQYDEDGFISLQNTASLLCYGNIIPITYHEHTNLPILFATLSHWTSPLHANTVSLTSHSKIGNSPHIISNTKPNLSNSQRLKLLWNERCNHRSMATINSWIQQGLLPCDSSIASAPDPICAACQAGKAHRKAHATTTNSIAAPCTNPGQQVSADQLEAGQPGRIPTTKGLPTNKRYKICNIWVDHYSRFIYPTFHESKHAADLINSKREF